MVDNVHRLSVVSPEPCRYTEFKIGLKITLHARLYTVRISRGESIEALSFLDP
jgi:hypothetical protein